jgi:hypothetical protein
MEKEACIYCNGDFIEICTMSRCSIYHRDPLGNDFYFLLNEESEILGNALISALEKSRDLSSTQDEKREFTENAPDTMSGKLREWYDSYHERWLNNKPERRLFEENLERKRYSEWVDNILKHYGYKNEKSLFKNMQLCSIAKCDEKMIFLPYGKREASQNDFKFTITSSSPPSVIGAAVKYSIARCTGKGADLVAKKLFPDGVPDTFEDYLKLPTLQKA